jgi:cytochrome P450
MWTEVLRHYCDNMIMRVVIADTTIPLEDQGLRWIQVKKGDMVISPCWVAHHDPRNWQEEATEPTPSVFMPDRFLGKSLRDVKAKALAGVSSAKMYPFGGGKSICAGRVSLCTCPSSSLTYKLTAKTAVRERGSSYSCGTDAGEL